MKVPDPGQLGLTVVRVAGQEAHCLCPFHEDNSMSASFNLVKGVMYCFVCKESWTTYQISKRLKTDITLIEMDRIKTENVEYDRPDWTWVMSTKLALDNQYLIGRGVTNAQVKEFGIREFDSGILFPLRDRWSTVIGAQARLYRGRTRYVFYGDRTTVWPMHKLGEAPNIVLVEGIFGALRARKFGVAAYALLGSNPDEVIPYVSGFKRKVCVFDDDAAGKKAAKEMLASGLGFEAYDPGAEADEQGEPFWQSIWHTPQLTQTVYKFAEA